MNSNIVLLLVFVSVVLAEECCAGDRNDLQVWPRARGTAYPRGWSADERIPMTTGEEKFRRFLLPLLLAYKLKFFTLIPVLIGGLILLTGATGLAGFFFALFAAVMGLKAGGSH
ncbi:hypothetical protein MTP99_016608 [Tenebrio molitor]|nr:hypothetical protein MTP99_016608 [Tenebrio molitor]